jgi:glutamate synthase domain-containing protein 2
MHHLRFVFSPRLAPLTLAVLVFAIAAIIALAQGPQNTFVLFGLLVFGTLTAVGIRDMLQTKHAILRNYPISGHIRFLLETIRPELRQYFFEGEKDGMPFSRDKRAIIYQRAKRALDKRPFGTQFNVYDNQFEWLNHSMQPMPQNLSPLRIDIGGPHCTQPYSASLLNISAMSFGSLSANAIRALNRGAKIGGFAHDTGEGSISPYHQEFGGDIIWEIGSGYFGCRNRDGSFSAEKFARVASLDQVKMIEVKLSQGAKPGHGGVLPAVKLTAEIAQIRGVALGQDCISPPSHSAFSTPLELVAFIGKLRTLSHGKPVGFKFCVGHRWEFMAIIKAMLETGIAPDFIVVDGMEGGTGAAPLEFMDHIGTPLRDGLNFVHSALCGAGLRDQIKIGVSGKITSAFDMARAMALGADWCNAARGFMFAVGCIQAQHCHTGKCPTGVATQDPHRQRAIVVPDKALRVANFHRETIEALGELIASVGLSHSSELRPHHFVQRVAPDRTMSLSELYPVMAAGELFGTIKCPQMKDAWANATAASFAPLQRIPT